MSFALLVFRRKMVYNFEGSSIEGRGEDYKIEMKVFSVYLLNGKWRLEKGQYCSR